MNWRTVGEELFVCFVCLFLLFAPRGKRSYRLREMNNLMSPLQSLLDDDKFCRGLIDLIVTEYQDKVFALMRYYGRVVEEDEEDYSRAQNGRGEERKRDFWSVAQENQQS